MDAVASAATAADRAGLSTETRLALVEQESSQHERRLSAVERIQLGTLLGVCSTLGTAVITLLIILGGHH